MKSSAAIWVLAILLVVVAAGWLVTYQRLASAQERAQKAEDRAAKVEQQLEEERQTDTGAEAKLEKVTKDNAPNGCTDCHKKVSEEKDYSLTAELQNIPGHPKVEANSVSDCAGCHPTTGQRALAPILHTAHIVDGEHYKESYDSNCINCHTIDNNGQVMVKGLQRSAAAGAVTQQAQGQTGGQ